MNGKLSNLPICTIEFYFLYVLLRGLSIRQRHITSDIPYRSPCTTFLNCYLTIMTENDFKEVQLMEKVVLAVLAFQLKTVREKLNDITFNKVQGFDKQKLLCTQPGLRPGTAKGSEWTFRFETGYYRVVLLGVTIYSKLLHIY